MDTYGARAHELADRALDDDVDPGLVDVIVERIHTMLVVCPRCGYGTDAVTS